MIKCLPHQLINKTTIKIIQKQYQIEMNDDRVSPKNKKKKEKITTERGRKECQGHFSAMQSAQDVIALPLTADYI